MPLGLSQVICNTVCIGFVSDHMILRGFFFSIIIIFCQCQHASLRGFSHHYYHLIVSNIHMLSFSTIEIKHSIDLYIMCCVFHGTYPFLLCSVLPVLVDRSYTPAQPVFLAIIRLIYDDMTFIKRFLCDICLFH